MKTRILLVEPEGEENIGMIARAMANFGVKELVLVNPNCNHQSGKAKSRAMHAQEILKKAKIAKNIEEGLNGASLSIGTTGQRPKGDSLRKVVVPVEEIMGQMSQTGSCLAIVFGRESTGLSNKELEKCDAIASIPSSPDYPVLNLANSASIILYELWKARQKSSFVSAKKQERDRLTSYFEKLAGWSGVRNKTSTVNAFKALVSRSPITKKEADAVSAVFSRVAKTNTVKKASKEK